MFRLMTSVSRRKFIAAKLELTKARKDKGNQTELTRFELIIMIRGLEL